MFALNFFSSLHPVLCKNSQNNTSSGPTEFSLILCEEVVLIQLEQN